MKIFINLTIAVSSLFFYSCKKTIEKGAVIKNKTDYSTQFITEFNKSIQEDSGKTSYEFKENLLLINQKDTVFFPSIPALEKETTLNGTKDGLRVSLTFKRINYSTINYHIELIDTGSEPVVYNGQADLKPTFYLGEESDESDFRRISYPVNEFVNYNDTCYTIIRIGEEEIRHKLLAKIVKNCNGKIKTIGLDNCPTLNER